MKKVEIRLKGNYIATTVMTIKEIKNTEKAGFTVKEV